MRTKYQAGIICSTRNTPANNIESTSGNGLYSPEFVAQLKNQTKWPTPGIVASGQIAYTTPGTYSWTAPAGVTSVCVVCVGGGGSGGAGYYVGGGAGGGLAYKNNISVTPGSSYTVVVGA